MALNTTMEVSPIFPDDYEFREHPVFPQTAWQWRYIVNDKTHVSIVAGEPGLWGDGYTTFEMWDYRNAEPWYSQTADEINRHFKENPIQL